MKSQWYQNYLKSDHWQTVRVEKLERERYCCERCGYFARRRFGQWVGIHVHHKNYERLGHERLDEDLEVLCEYCHECEHGLNKRSRDKLRARWTVGVVEYAEEIDGL
jgi:5-methylcytosine-specific restriction endonuclease McrA